MNRNNFKSQHLLITILSLILIIALAGCASYQASNSKSGKILNDKGKEVTLNIGNYENPMIGKTYKVFEYRTLIDKDSPKKTNVFEKKYIGEIKITELLKDNNAKGILIKGKAKTGDTVELKDKKFEKFDYSIIENILD